MDREVKYSAGLVSQCFWFIEFRKVLLLRQDGMNYDDIKKLCVEENLFGAVKEYRANRMAGYVINRAKRLDDELMHLFFNSDLATQKIINFIAILKSDRLLTEFLYEVYREKLILGAGKVNLADVNMFFAQKESQSLEVAKIQDNTRKRLRSCYLNFLAEAMLINNKRLITPPVLDRCLEEYLKDKNEHVILKALIGGM